MLYSRRKEFLNAYHGIANKSLPRKDESKKESENQTKLLLIVTDSTQKHSHFFALHIFFNDNYSRECKSVSRQRLPILTFCFFFFFFRI